MDTFLLKSWLHQTSLSSNKMQCIVKMSNFSVFYFSLMRENWLPEDLPNILENVLYSLCNKTQAIRNVYVQTRSDRTPHLETKF
jgi:hypothetical protein